MNAAIPERRRIDWPGQKTLARTALLAGCVLLFTGCEWNLPGKPNPKDRPLPAEDVLAFDALYNRNCAGCHGPDGKQGPAPPLNDPLFRSIISTAELTMVISDGRPGTPMPAFARPSGGALSSAQVEVLVNEIKGRAAAPRWGPVSAAPPSVPAYPLPEMSGTERAGQRVFARACAGCHGANGKGVAGAAQRPNAINDPAFLALISDQALRRIIITGRPDLMMPSFAEDTARPDGFKPLTSEEIADLGALLAAWRTGQSVGRK